MTATGAGVGSQHQHKTAAAFFAKKNKKGSSLPPSSPRRIPEGEHSPEDCRGFTSILTKCPPPPPQQLFKKLQEPKDTGQGMGKVRVYLRVMTTGSQDQALFRLDKKKRQVTLLGPEKVLEDQALKTDSAESTAGSQQQEKKPVDVLAPRMFAFDGVFTGKLMSFRFSQQVTE